ncbi:MAG TPA: PDZ domain-containing protein [Candidatus Binataceae bacterium]|nr:PDZ domain-containing protein [Candidatus Binataceae bacterium]
MERQGETGIRYLSIDEMFLKIDRLRTEREQSSAAAEGNPDYVAHFEAWAAGEAAGAPWMEHEPAPEPAKPTREASSADLLSSGDYVWIGDDMAVHLEAADPQDLAAFLAHDDDEQEAIEDFDARELDAEELNAADQPWRTAPIGFLAKWGIERYALGATALGIAALVVLGTALHMGRVETARSTLAAAAGLMAGHDPYSEITGAENLIEVEAPTGPFGVAAAAPRRRRQEPGQIEEQVHQALADRGFWDIGVSAGNRGDVYLAGDVYSMAEAHYVMAVACRAAHVARVFFLHPDVQPAEGPAYFGAVAAYAPSVWGAKITSVAIGSPAYMAGVREGDIIRGFDHKTIADADELRAAVAAHQPGQRIQIRVWRDNANDFLTARLETLPSTVVAMR